MGTVKQNFCVDEAVTRMDPWRNLVAFGLFILGR